jgi:uncharacterized membrane protein
MQTPQAPQSYVPYPPVPPPAPDPDGRMTDEELAPYRRRGRISSVVMFILGGAGLWYISYLLNTGDGVPIKLIFVAALGIVFGLAGLIEPLIMYRHKPEGKRFPRTVNLVFLLTLMLMFAAVYGIMSLFGLHWS